VRVLDYDNFAARIVVSDVRRDRAAYLPLAAGVTVAYTAQMPPFSVGGFFEMPVRMPAPE
jgi:hypothetical protein